MKHFDCRVLDGFLQECEADEKGAALAKAAAAAGDCPFGRRCYSGKSEQLNCVSRQPLPVLPGVAMKSTIINRLKTNR